MSNHRQTLVAVALLLAASVLAWGVTVALLGPTPLVETGVTATAPAPTATPYPPGPDIISTYDYDIVRRLSLRNEGPGTTSRITLWVALIRRIKPYQELLARQAEPSDFQVLEVPHEHQDAPLQFTDVALGNEPPSSSG